MRPQRKANAAGTPAYKYIYIFFLFPPLPEEERNFAARVSGSCQDT